MRKLCLLLVAYCSLLSCVAQNISIELNKGWQFRQAATNKWYKAEIPGTVHTDLLANKLIPDPFYRDNEKKVQWVEEKAWEYKTIFNVTADLFKKKNIEIEFDGLDTYAEVLLNGKKIREADNMFRQWTADVKSFLKLKGNVLQVRFLPAVKIAQERKKGKQFLILITKGFL